MLIEGNLLIALLAGVSIAIVLVVVILRYAIKNGFQSSGSLLSALGRGGSHASPEEAEEGAPGETVLAGAAEDDLSLPDIDGLDDLSAEPLKDASKAQVEKKGTGMAGLSTVIKELLGNLLGRRKKKEEQQQDTKEIDDLLNQVLQESQNFGLDSPGTGIKAPELSTLSDSQSLRDIDKEIRNQQRQEAAEARKPEPAQPQQQSIEGLNPYLQGGSLLDLSQPAEPAKAQEPPKPQEQAKPDLSKQPIGPKPPVAENTFKGGAVPDATTDLLSEIAAESVKEEHIDLSIMKDLKDVPIACDDLEKDLTGILGQISTNVQASGGKRRKPA